MPPNRLRVIAEDLLQAIRLFNFARPVADIWNFKPGPALIRSLYTTRFVSESPIAVFERVSFSRQETPGQRGNECAEKSRETLYDVRLFIYNT